MNPCATPGCPETRPESAYVCRSCVRRLRTLLDQVPALYGELSATYARQDTLGPTSGRQSGPAPLPYKPHASEAMSVLGNVVATWALTLVTDHDTTPADTNPARYLRRNLPALASHPDAGQAVDEITDAVQLGWRTVDRPPDSLLAGQCTASTPDGPCRTPLYARPYDAVTACPVCHTSHDVADRRTDMLEAAKDILVTHHVALGWVRLLTDRAVPAGTWRSWVSRGRVTPHAVDPAGRYLYRFGDVYGLATGRTLVA